MSSTKRKRSVSASSWQASKHSCKRYANISSQPEASRATPATVNVSDGLRYVKKQKRRHAALNASERHSKTDRGEASPRPVSFISASRAENAIQGLTVPVSLSASGGGCPVRVAVCSDRSLCMRSFRLSGYFADDARDNVELLKRCIVKHFSDFRAFFVMIFFCCLLAVFHVNLPFNHRICIQSHPAVD